GSATTANVSFEYGTDTSYGSTTVPQIKTAIGTLSANLIGLTPSTTYYFRAKADNVGVATGADMSFTTLTPTPPTVSTSPATSVTSNAATVSGYLASLGTATTANVSFEYGLTTSYGSTTLAQAKIVAGTFSANLTGLTPDTTYHFRAKADGDGTATGADKTFITPTPIYPLVTTSAATSITSSTATVSGNLTDLGTATTANVSFEYGLTTSYGSTTAPQVKMTIGTFSANLTGLSSGTTYHFRAKADGDGTATGANMSFATLTPPTATTDNVTNITTTSATVSGNLTDLGTATTANVSFEYGLTTSYGSTTAPQVKMTIGTFSANLTGLSSGTTYHFRAKADSGIHGITTSADVTFTTTTAAPPPSGGGGGGGSSGDGIDEVGGSEPVVTSVTDVITEEGIFTQKVTIESNDSKVELAIDEETTGKTAEGEPLSEISVATVAEPPTLPTGANTVGLTYELGPSGATFDPPITLTFTYDPDAIPEGVSEADLIISRWNEDTGKWVDLEGGTVDTATNAITVPLDRFSKYAVLARTLPVAFTISAVTISPTEVTTGETVTISLLVTNPGDIEATYQVILKVDGVVASTKDVTLAGSTSQKVTFTTSQNTAGTYTINVADKSGIFTVKTPTAQVPDAFTTSPLIISPTEVITGETVTISLLVTNPGDIEATYQVILKVDGVVASTKDVTLAGSTSQKVTFTTSQNTAGTYTINVADKSGIFSVKTPTALTIPINWWLVGAIVSCIAVALLAWKKRRSLALLRDKIYANPTDKRIAHIYTVEPLGSGKHALVIEFGVRVGEMEGLHVGVNIDAELTDVREWVNEPNNPTITVIGTDTIRKFATGYKPPMHERKLMLPHLRPTISYYWYFEAENLLIVKDVLFLDYYDRKP
ncbi:CARDB domain-containing protein, partial [Chloroflexota bacterium]